MLELKAYSTYIYTRKYALLMYVSKLVKDNNINYPVHDLTLSSF